MKLCRYCKQKISWFGGIDHSVCEIDAKKHKSYIHSYIRESIVDGSFDIKNTSQEFRNAEKYLSASEIQDAIAYGYDDAVMYFIDDTVVDGNESANWTQFRNNLEENLNQSFKEVSEWLNIYNTDRVLHMGMVLTDLKAGKMPSSTPPSNLVLSKNEKYIFSWNNVNGHALNIKKRFKGHSTGGSYRLTKKFSVRHNQFRGKPVIYSEWNQIGNGTLALTNEHLYFLGYGSSRDVKERLSKVISLDPTENGFIVNINLKSRPAYRFTMQSRNIAWMASNFILNAQSL